MNDRLCKVFKGNTFTRSQTLVPKNITFDLDETLGSFGELYILWKNIEPFIPIHIKKQNVFRELLDLYPEFLRPNIINILNYLKTKKESNCCHKMLIYTNNTGPREWCRHIIDYFEKKINYKIIDQVISAFKINGKTIEISRTTHNKTHSDLVRCTKIPLNAEICFLDDTFYPGMENERIYYINCKPYYYDISFTEMCSRFLESNVSKKILSKTDLFTFGEKMNTFLKNYTYKYIEKDSKEYEIDKIVGKYIIKHLKIFFNEKQQQNKTVKKYRTKQKNKTKTKK
jgi:hypothetical protein